MSPISERSAFKWHYPENNGKGVVLSDIQELQDLAQQWRTEDLEKKDEQAKELQAQQRRQELEKRAAEYPEELQKEQDNFLREGTRFARVGNEKDVKETLEKIRHELLLLEPHDHFDQLFAHKLSILQNALQDRLKWIDLAAEAHNKTVLNRWSNQIENYLSTYRKVYVRDAQGKQELRTQPPVETALSQEETPESWRSSAEYEAHFDAIAIKQSLENDRARQDLLKEIVEVALENALKKGLIDQETVDTLQAKLWEPDAEFEKWFEGKDVDPSERQKIIDNYILQSYEEVVGILVKRCLTEESFIGVIPFTLVQKFEQTKQNTVNLKHLRNSAEIIHKALFSTEDLFVSVWDFLTRPDIKKSILRDFDRRSRGNWKLLSETQRKKYQDVNEYIKKKRTEIEEHLKLKTSWEQPAFLLTYLGVDMDLLLQVVNARRKNNGHPFDTEGQAQQALFTTEGTGVEWWQDIQTLETHEPFLAPLTKREVLVADDFIAPVPDSEALTRHDRRMNFVHALHLKIGLDTPSKYVDYQKTAEAIEMETAQDCLEILGSYFSLRKEIPQSGERSQLEHFKTEAQFVERNMANFALAYVRLNQTLGDTTGRSTDAGSPARKLLYDVFVKNAEREEYGSRTGAFTALIDRELTDWLAANRLPHEEIFTPAQNEEERMS